MEDQSRCLLSESANGIAVEKARLIDVYAELTQQSRMSMAGLFVRISSSPIIRDINWITGPIASAMTTVPTPIAPPNNQPPARTAISRAVRVSRTLQPVFRLKPSINPSRGPAPS